MVDGDANAPVDIVLIGTGSEVSLCVQTAKPSLQTNEEKGLCISVQQNEALSSFLLAFCT